MNLTLVERVIIETSYLLSEPYKFVISAIKLTGLDSHPKNVVSRRDIIKFANDKKLNIKELGRLFWFYYGLQLHKL